MPVSDSAWQRLSDGMMASTAPRQAQGPITSLYVAVALTFSSSIIIIKLLSDKREIDALHRQIALGF